jgi:hypothetical protein
MKQNVRINFHFGRNLPFLPLHPEQKTHCRENLRRLLATRKIFEIRQLLPFAVDYD